MLRSFLLAPCLLICLACATPFPFESLEEGMTAEAVREKFGEPEAMDTEPEGVDSSWTYLHEEQIWDETVLFYSIGIPHCIIFTAWMPFVEGHPCYSWIVERKPVVLQFSEGKLTSWEVLPDPRPSSCEDRFGKYGCYSGDPIISTHEMMGHPGHIHGDGC